MPHGSEGQPQDVFSTEDSTGHAQTTCCAQQSTPPPHTRIAREAASQTLDANQPWRIQCFLTHAPPAAAVFPLPRRALGLREA